MSEARNRQLALVTGASSGIGRELAHLCASDDYDLVVSAEDDGVDEIADSLRGCGVGVRAVRADLRVDAEVDRLWREAQAIGRPVQVAALNAGVGLGGRFVDQGLEEALDVVRLDVVGTIRLAHHVLGDMVRRNSGRVLLTSSVAATTPGPYQAVYNASKSFVQSFAEAMQVELDPTGVEVTSLMPGPTATNFFHRAAMKDTRIGRGPQDDPAAVARAGYEALIAGRRKVTAASATSRAQGALAGLLPDAAKARLHRLMAEPDDPAQR